MKARRDTTLLTGFFFASVFIQNATFSVGTVQIGFILVPVVLFAFFFFRRRIGFVPTPYFRVSFIFLGYALIRTFTSPHLSEALVVLVYLGLDFVVMFMTYAFTVYVRYHRLEHVVILSVNGLMLVGVLIYLYLYSNYDPLTIATNFEAMRQENIRKAGSFWDVMSYASAEGDVLRFNGFYLDPNNWGLYAFTGLYFVTVMKLCLDAEKTPPYWLRGTFGYLAYLPTLLSCLFTFSRGVMLGLVVVGVSVLVSAFRSNPRLGLRLLVGTTIGFAGLALWLVPLLYGDSVLETLLINKTTGDLDQTSIARPFVWQTYLMIFSNWSGIQLLFGVGMSRVFYEDVGFFMATHNYIMQILAMMGLVGLSLHLYMSYYLALIIRAGQGMFRSARFRYGIKFSFLVGTLLISFFIDPLYQLPFWMFSGMTIGLVQYDQLVLNRSKYASQPVRELLA